MKKLFGLMVFCGMLLAVATAGGVDSGVINGGKILCQSAISAILIFTGSYFLRGGEKA